MAAGIWNLLFGLAFVAGGVSGKWLIIGTHDPLITVGLGVVMGAWGVSQLYRSHKRSP